MGDARQPAFISKQVVDGRYFFLDLAPRRDLELGVVCGGREQCAPDYEIDRQEFPFHAVEYVADGEGELLLGEQNHPLTPGSVFVYGPGVPHRIRSSRRRPLVKYFLTFSGRRARPLLEGGPHRLVRTRWIHDILDQLLDAGTLPRNVARRQCRMLLDLLAARLAIDAQPLDEAGSRSFQTYSRCRRYIEDHYRTIGGAAAVAAACGVAPAYLARLFRRFAQAGPYQFLVRLRMDAAADKLAQRDASVAAVAEMVGYLDPYHFSRVFKRAHGLSPRAFAGSVRRRTRA
jgi:AraC-like DNA-binding protein